MAIGRGSAAVSVGPVEPHGAQTQVHVRDPAGSASVDAGVAAIAPIAPIAVHTRKATINATPWAYFTIDDDATQHTTVETLDLAVGEHRLHFWNPALHAERYATVTVEADRDLRFVIALDR